MKVAPNVLSPATQLARDTARLSLKSQNSFNKHSRRTGYSNSLSRWSNQLALNAATENGSTSTKASAASTKPSISTKNVPGSNLAATSEKSYASSTKHLPVSNLMSTPKNPPCPSRRLSELGTSPCGEEFTPGEMSPTLGYSTLKKCQSIEDVTPKRGAATRRSRRVLNQPVFKEHTTEVTTIGRVQESEDAYAVTNGLKNTAVKKPTIRTLKSGSKLRGSEKKRRKSRGLLCGITTSTDSPIIGMPSPRRSPRIQNMKDRKVPPMLTDFVRDPKTAWVVSPRDFTPIPDFYASFKLPKLDQSASSESSMLDAVLSTLDRKSRRMKHAPKASNTPEKVEPAESGSASEENMDKESPQKSMDDDESPQKIAQVKKLDAPPAERVPLEKKFVSSYSVPQQEKAVHGVRVVSTYFDLQEIPMIDDDVSAKAKAKQSPKSEKDQNKFQEIPMIDDDTPAKVKATKSPKSDSNQDTIKDNGKAASKDSRIVRRPTRKNSFLRAVQSPNPSVQSEKLETESDNHCHMEVIESEAQEKENIEKAKKSPSKTQSKENVEAAKKSPRVEDTIKSKSMSELPKSQLTESTKPRSVSSITLPQEKEEEFKINRPRRKRSVKFMEQPTQIEAPKESTGTLQRMVSNSGLFKKMKRNRSVEKLRGRKGEEEGPLVRDAGRTPRPQRQPKTPFQERLIL